MPAPTWQCRDENKKVETENKTLQCRTESSKPNSTANRFIVLPSHLDFPYPQWRSSEQRRRCLHSAGVSLSKEFKTKLLRTKFNSLKRIFSLLHNFPNTADNMLDGKERKKEEEFEKKVFLFFVVEISFITSTHPLLSECVTLPHKSTHTRVRLKGCWNALVVFGDFSSAVRSGSWKCFLPTWRVHELLIFWCWWRVGWKRNGKIISSKFSHYATWKTPHSLAHWRKHFPHPISGFD